MNELILAGIIIVALSGVPGLFLNRYALHGQRLSILFLVLGASLGLAGVGLFWTGTRTQSIDLSWPLPGATFSVTVDGLSAVFLVPIFLIGVLGTIYGAGYWRQTDHPDNGRKLRLFYGTMTAGMALLVVARNGILFLFGWEIMALSAFFLVNTEDDRAEVREAGWIYLVATHVATLLLFALFGLLYTVNGSFALVAIKAENLTPGIATAIFVLALLGFGVKAGIMPLHVWLPGAHAMAPSHVSALMSGVLIKMGIYGLARITSLLPDPLPVTWGALVLGLGVVSGVLGVAFAVGQHDLKRLLAYHSIENIGIIVMGLGLALLGRSFGRADWVLLGMCGALLHVWNHSVFKALLFLSAGSVIHAAHTRDIDHLGGLAKGMPWTASAFVVGAVAICGLPPLNGFVSEFLLYLGLFGTLSGSGVSFAGAAFAAPALALIGALAVACFVKVYGAVFLGTARTKPAQQVHEAKPTMLAPMAVLVLCCVLIGLVPRLVMPAIVQGVTAWAPGAISLDLHALAPLRWITIMNGLLLGLVATSAAALWLRLRSSVVARGPTWGCGYLAPTPRMQYTSSSFAQMLVQLFGWALRPRTRQPRHLPLFPHAAKFHSEVPDPVLDEAVVPGFRLGAWLISWVRVLQQGSVQAYLLYIFIALIALLLWR